MESGKEKFEKRQIEWAMLNWQRKYYEMQKLSTVVIAIATVANVVITLIRL